MKLKPRTRSIALWGGSFLAVGLSLHFDPDDGLSTILGGVSMAQGIIGILLAFLFRKFLMDYPEADQQSLFRKAKETSTGAGLALIAKALIFIGLLAVFVPRAMAQELPPGFFKYWPVLQAEQKRYWPDHPDPAALAAQTEQESCPSLKSSMCWNPGARLKTDREEGAGMLQVTRAYRKDGSLRFDTLSDLTAKYRNDLSGWNWNNVYQRPDMQLRALVLLSRDSTMPFRVAKDRLKFGASAYNGGIGNVKKERMACKATPGCNPDYWKGNVENHCLRSRQSIYGGRSACDIRLEYVRNIFDIRRPKYVRYMNGD